MDAYVRAVLAEALGYGLAYGIVAGTGKDQPIGMLKDINGAVTNGVYPDKTAITITSLDAVTIGGIGATLATGRIIVSVQFLRFSLSLILQITSIRLCQQLLI